MRQTIVTLLLILFLLPNSEYSYSDTDIDKGKVELKNHRLEQAKQHFLTALRRNPDSVEAKIGLAKIYRQDRRNYEIEESLVRQVLEADPDNIEGLRLQGEIYYSNEEWTLASATYKKIISIYPDDYAAHVNLSVILRELGDFEGVRRLSEDMKKMHQPR
jgi:tetratricopeptide (TPR) repeat protein